MTRYELALELDGAYQHSIDSEDVPKAVASVAVRVIYGLIEYDSMMVAGSVGMRVSSSGEPLHGKEETGLNTVQPESGWWIYEKKEKEGAEKVGVDMYFEYSYI
jgi:hypothetical protein